MRKSWRAVFRAIWRILPGMDVSALSLNVGAIAARGIFVAAGLDSVLPFQLFVCSSVGLVVAALTSLIWFG